jgi:intraflagellar transport protein 81
MCCTNSRLRQRYRYALFLFIRLCPISFPLQFDVKELEAEETNRRLIESLKRIQYQPKEAEVDPGGFHKALLLGHKKVVHPIFLWIFQNRERVEKTAYLAKYLLPLNLPNEAMAMPEIGNIYQQYKLAMEEFKEAHKQQASSAIVGSHTRELKSDIGAIEAEIENVKKRIERTQTKLDKIPQQELLLETARALRIEKERQKELAQQIQEQQQSVSRANLMNDRLKKELASARSSAQGTTAAHLLENVVEETQVLDFMVQQKLPQELKARQTEVEILQEVLEEPNLSRNYLTELQGRIDAVNREVQRSIDKKMSEHGNDALGPFRQQANIVARNKETAAEQLDQLTKELRDVETTLAQKQEQLQQSVGEVVLRGDDLKQFVNTLRAKSNVYKQQRADLTSIKAEINDLTQTLENLKSHDPSLSATLPQVLMDSSNPESLSLEGVEEAAPSAQGVTELKRLVEGLGRAVAASRERLTPLSQEVRPLRERLMDLKDERHVKKQVSIEIYRSQIPGVLR